MKTNLEFHGIPNASLTAFAEGVQETLAQLDMSFSYDEMGDSSVEGESVYRVIGVKPETEESKKNDNIESCC